MNAFLYVIIGFLLGTTIAFLYFVFASKKINAGQAKIYDQFKLTHDSIGDVDSGIKDLKGTLTQNIIPNLEAVYQRVDADSFDLLAEKLLNLIHRAGIENAASLTENGSLVGFGIEEGPLKVSYLINYDLGSNDLIIRTVSSTIPPLNQETLNELLSLNHSIKIGTLGLSQVGSHSIISVDYAWHLPKNRVLPEALYNIFNRIFLVHQKIIEIYNQNNIEYKVILLHEYISLLLASSHPEVEVKEKEVVL